MLDPEAPGLPRLRAVLEDRGYLGPDAQGVLGAGFGPEHLRLDLPLYERRLAEPRPLHTLVKLFALHRRVEERAAREAFAPLPLEEVVAMGLVTLGEDRVRPEVGLQTVGSLVVARDRPADGSTILAADHVLGLNQPAFRLASLTVRRPVESVLDLGCGGGIQALLAAGHARRVVAVDVNPRALAFTRWNARLNGIANVECRQGDLFDPVKGERFDLLVCNPPYTVSPDAQYVFRDSGRPGDSLCAEVVRQIPAHLEEGGFATVLCNWALREGEGWPDPLRRWVEGSGCDAWLLHHETQDPLTYAAAWNRDGDAREYGGALDRWCAYYREAGIAALGLGALVLRRRAGDNWVRCDEMPGDPEGRSSEQILRAFEAEDRLLPLDDASLLARRFRPADELQIRETRAPGGDRRHADSVELHLLGGLGLRGSGDSVIVRLLEGCDGRRPLGEAMAEAASEAGISGPPFPAQALLAVRRLVSLGFLVSADERAEGGNDDADHDDGAAAADAPAAGFPGGGERAGAGFRR